MSIIEKGKQNRTIALTEIEKQEILPTLPLVADLARDSTLENRIFLGDCLKGLDLLPPGIVDLAVIDPPYNLGKDYGVGTLEKMSIADYALWLESWVTKLIPLLKPTASVYVCCDWRSSPLIYEVLANHFLIQNRITWERDKGRGAKKNWKNNLEDIWFATVSPDYTFNLEAVKIKRPVIAPYRNAEGEPKDWVESPEGNYRLTHPSNLWTDITIPFWSMPENTPHPTQKPEKLISRLILASSHPGDLVLDPFMGVGTTAVVCAKLERRYLGFEINPDYLCYAYKRLALASENPQIQGLHQGIYSPRNS